MRRSFFLHDQFGRLPHDDCINDYEDAIILAHHRARMQNRNIIIYCDTTPMTIITPSGVHYNA